MEKEDDFNANFILFINIEFNDKFHFYFDIIIYPGWELIINSTKKIHTRLTCFVEHLSFVSIFSYRAEITTRLRQRVHNQTNIVVTSFMG